MYANVAVWSGGIVLFSIIITGFYHKQTFYETVSTALKLCELVSSFYFDLPRVLLKKRTRKKLEMKFHALVNTVNIFICLL